MIGTTVAHYRIVSKLGSGGMGVVYKAEDLRLGRSVALKFIPEDLSDHPLALDRFHREARAVSALNHPNICTLFDATEADGRPFLVMEYLVGQTLRERISIGPLKIGDILEYAIQIADAIETAHAAGVVHRDIKPANIFVTPRGIKIMDFGLAKVAASVNQSSSMPTAVVDNFITSPGSTLGTIMYMSPEQASGEELDKRTDLFSFGVVLYEMCTGVCPFQGNTTALTFNAILNRDPVPAQQLRADLPGDLDRIIGKSLEKNRDMRYQGAAEMRADLKRLQRDISSGKGPGASSAGSISGASSHPYSTGSAPSYSSRADSARPNPQSAGGAARPARRWITQAAIAAAVLLLAGAGAWYYTLRDKPLDSIAVLPFVNVGSDPNIDYLADGISESVINTLSQVPRLSVRSFSSVSRYRNKEVDPQSAGRDLNVAAVITGRLMRHGDSISINTELIDVRHDRLVWGYRNDQTMANMLTVQEQIAREVSDRLRMPMTGKEKERMARHTTEDSAAYQLYLQGRYQWNKRSLEGMQQSIDFFQQAIQRDPKYALAHAGLADAYALLADNVLPAKEVMPRMEASATKALELDDSLSEAHTSLAWARFVHDWDWTGAEREFKRAIELNPNYPTAHAWYGEFLMVMSRSDEALAQFNRARSLNPQSPVVNTSLGSYWYYNGKYSQAVDQLRNTLTGESEFIPAHLWLARTYEQQGSYPDALREFQKVLALSGEGSQELASLGQFYAVSHREAEARKILADLKQRSDQTYVQPMLLAGIHAALGAKDEAFQWLQKASDDRSVALVYLKLDPHFARLRTDPRYQELIRRIGLP